MSIRIIEKDSRKSPGGDEMFVTVESDQPLDLQATDLRHPSAMDLAFDYASSRGIGAPRLTGMDDIPYTVNKDGVPIHSLLKQADGKAPDLSGAAMQPWRFRRTIRIGRAHT